MAMYKDYSGVMCVEACSYSASGAMGHCLQCPLGARPSGWRRFVLPGFQDFVGLTPTSLSSSFLCPLGTNLLFYFCIRSGLLCGSQRLISLQLGVIMHGRSIAF